MHVLLKTTFLVLSILFSLLIDGQPNDDVNKAKKLLENGSSVSTVLSDPQFDSIRPETAFRELIKQYANQKSLTYVTNTEAGEKITVKGTLNKDGQPLSNTLIYVYQTDTRGGMEAIGYIFK